MSGQRLGDSGQCLGDGFYWRPHLPGTRQYIKLSHFRWEIFHIHTQQMKENGFLADDVNIKDLAANTTQFSGAEIAGIVRLAASYALDRKVCNSSRAVLGKDWREKISRLRHKG